MKKKLLLFLTLILVLGVLTVGCVATDDKEPEETEKVENLEDDAEDSKDIKDDEEIIDTEDKNEENAQKDNQDDKVQEDELMVSMRDIEGPKRFLEGWEIGEISKIEIEDVMAVIKIEEEEDDDEENYVKVFKLNERGGKPTGFDERDKIVLDNGVLKLTENFEQDELFIVINQRNLKDVEVSVKGFGGVLFLDDEVKKIDLLDIYGVINMEGDRTFDIYGDNISGVLNVEFDEDINATIRISDVSGVASVFGEQLGAGKTSEIEKTIGNGDKVIIIENVSGVLKLKYDD